jgi:hypothetical protein
MIPLYPPYPIADLAHEHLAGRRPNGRPRRHHPLDPDGFHDPAPSLHPDPIFMGLRGLMARGPVGRLVQWIERRVMAREDRLHNARAEDIVGKPTESERPLTAGRTERNPDIAA